MTYSETVQYLYTSAPLFQHQGAGAYKEGLTTTHLLDEHFGHPHRQFQTIHIAGTNGKGSCSHTLAAILQSAGYKVGLYTSPHLVDFRERIRVNGEMIPEQRVVDFVARERSFFEPLHPSFFELATALAFLYFAEQQIDIAVIEVGLGGRLDCTNIIRPLLSVITNISFDHVAFLGDTLAQIAGEKAGIIKPEIPVIIGETHPETRPVFERRASEVGAPIVFAQESVSEDGVGEDLDHLATSRALTGYCQEHNTCTIIAAIRQLRSRLHIPDAAVERGFREVCSMTGLRGRWETLRESPRVICDTGHNVGGIQYIVRQLADLRGQYTALRMVFGMVSDKDITSILTMLPKDAIYYFCQASVQRARPAAAIAEEAARHGLHGSVCGSVADACHAALSDAAPTDLIFVGGSSFVVADLLAMS